jgi:hypothetical protein
MIAIKPTGLTVGTVHAYVTGQLSVKKIAGLSHTDENRV